MHQALDQSRKVQSDDVHLNSEDRQVLLDEVSHLFSRTISGVGQDGELHRVALTVDQGVSPLVEAFGLQEPLRSIAVFANRGKVLGVPDGVCWRYKPVGGGSVPAIPNPPQVAPMNGLRGCDAEATA